MKRKLILTIVAIVVVFGCLSLYDAFGTFQTVFAQETVRTDKMSLPKETVKTAEGLVSLLGDKNKQILFAGVYNSETREQDFFCQYIKFNLEASLIQVKYKDNRLEVQKRVNSLSMAKTEIKYTDLAGTTNILELGKEKLADVLIYGDYSADRHSVQLHVFNYETKSFVNTRDFSSKFSTRELDDNLSKGMAQCAEQIASKINRSRYRQSPIGHKWRLLCVYNSEPGEEDVFEKKVKKYLYSGLENAGQYKNITERPESALEVGGVKIDISKIDWDDVKYYLSESKKQSFEGVIIGEFLPQPNKKVFIQVKVVPNDPAKRISSSSFYSSPDGYKQEDVIRCAQDLAKKLDKYPQPFSSGSSLVFIGLYKQGEKMKNSSLAEKLQTSLSEELVNDYPYQYLRVLPKEEFIVKRLTIDQDVVIIGRYNADLHVQVEAIHVKSGTSLGTAEFDTKKFL